MIAFPAASTAGPGAPRRRIRPSPLGLSLALAVLLATSPAHAQLLREAFPVTSPSVYALAQSGSTLYVGGSFGIVGPATGSAVMLDLATGRIDPAFPRADGRVVAASPDGAGGWYLGGEFTAVGGQPRLRLAHVLPDRSVAAWDPAPDGSVSALVVHGGTVYVAGNFAHVGGAARRDLAALDAATGQATAWDPNPEEFGEETGVMALAVRGPTVYVGGYFNRIGGDLIDNLAAIDSTTGLARDWKPGPYSSVTTLALGDSVLYVAGAFEAVGGVPRKGLAAVDLATGAVTDWNPEAGVEYAEYIEALVVHGATVYAGGDFYRMGTVQRSYLAAIDARSGAIRDWRPTASFFVHSLAVIGSTVYAGGGFTRLDDAERWCLAAIDSATGAVTSWDPRMNADVYALATDGASLLAGGAFTSVGGEYRNNLAAIDLTSGRLTDWQPGPDGPVYALEVDGTSVLAGGSFTRAGGLERHDLAALDATTGAATEWAPAVDGPVTALVAADPLVYLGGLFHRVGGEQRSVLAAVDATSGAPTAWNPDLELPPEPIYPHPHPPRVTDLVLDGTRLYAGGEFTLAAGQPRRNLVAVSTTTGLPEAWDPSPDRPVRALLLANGALYVGGEFDSIGGTARHFLAAVDPGNGRTTAWDPAANGTVLSLAADRTADPVRNGPPEGRPGRGPGGHGQNGQAQGLERAGTIFTSGLFTRIGGQAREHFAALDAGTGLATSWAPRANAGAIKLIVSGTALYAGGGFTSIDGLPRSGIAALSIPGTPGRGRPAGTVAATSLGARSAAPALEGAVANPGRAAELALAFTLSGGDPAWLTLFDVTGRAAWHREVGALGPGRHVLRVDGGRRLAAGIYWIRLEEGARSRTVKTVVLP